MKTVATNEDGWGSKWKVSNYDGVIEIGKLSSV